MFLGYLAYKFHQKTKIVSLDSIPLDDAFEQADDYVDEPEGKQKGWVRAISWIWD